MQDAGTATAGTTRDDALAALLGRAQVESTVTAWMAYADGLSSADRFAEAIDVRQQVDEQLEGGPERERIHLAQAADHLNLGQLNVALQQFSHLAETATDSSVRSAATNQIDRIRQQQHDLAEYAQWQRLKAAAMRERIDIGPDRYSDHCQLCRALVGLWTAGDPTADYGTVDRATSDAIVRYGDSAELHELRALFLLRSPLVRNADLEAELKKLEEIAPDSPVLREFATIGEDELAEHNAQVWERTRSLLGMVFQPDPQTQAGAVADLRALAAEFPENTEVRSALALALACTDHPQEAIEQAEWVVPRAGASSELHLTLGQVFWHAGDHARGREHLSLAAEYATTDADRADVESLRSSLGA